jgi:hypothetical protein
MTFRRMRVDTTHVGSDLDGFRTLFTAFHHFRPEEVRAVLADAVRNDCGIGAFEATERSVTALLLARLAPLIVLIVTPLMAVSLDAIVLHLPDSADPFVHAVADPRSSESLYLRFEAWR